MNDNNDIIQGSDQNSEGSPIELPLPPSYRHRIKYLPDQKGRVIWEERSETWYFLDSAREAAEKVLQENLKIEKIEIYSNEDGILESVDRP